MRANPDKIELELTASLLDAALESTADGILVVDLHGNVVKYNSKFASMWRIPPEVLALRSSHASQMAIVDQLLKPEEFLNKVKELYARPEADSYDLIEFKDERFYERFSQPQRLGAKIVGRVWSFRDVTFQKKTEKELIESQHMIERFISIAAHELRTPLTSLKAQVQLINHLLVNDRMDAYAKEKLHKLIRMSDHEMKRFSGLIDSLLDLSRIRSGRMVMQPEPVELTRLAKNVVDYLEPQLHSARCEIEWSLEEPLSGNWDPSRIEQVLINLLSNAMKFGEGKSIRISVLRQDCRAILSIRDQGVGLSVEDQSRIFQPYESLINSGKKGGMGIGLCIANEIIQAHDGSIQVQSQPGRGCEFTVSLPMGS